MSEKRTIRIEDGLSIYKMDGSKNWYVYINKLGIKRQFSLKTDLITIEIQPALAIAEA